MSKRRIIEMTCGGCGATFPSGTSHRCESMADQYDRRLRAEGAASARAEVKRRVLEIINEAYRETRNECYMAEGALDLLNERLRERIEREIGGGE